jgi:hypothetical protein
MFHKTLNNENTDITRGPISVNDDDKDTFNVTSVIKDTLIEDKMDTSIVPLSRSKEKKPKYSQSNAKNLGRRSSKKVVIAAVEPSQENSINKKRKKKLVYKSPFLHFVDIENWKSYNKRNTWPDGMPEEPTDEDSCKKCKDVFEKTCLII